MAKPIQSVRLPWYSPARIVWKLPWLGLVFALNTIVAILIIISADNIADDLGTGHNEFIIPVLGVIYGLGFVLGVLPTLVNIGALAMAIASAVLLFRSSTRAGGYVAFLYKSLSPTRRKLNIALWFSLVAFIVFQFMPFISAESVINTFFPSRYTHQALDLIGGIGNSFSNSVDMTVAVISITIPIVISLGFALALAYALFMFLFMATLRPNSALLLKRIFYIFALALATVVPLGIVPTPIGFRSSINPNASLEFSFYSSHPALINLLAPTFLLLIISLVWLYFQRSRLAELGARVKEQVRWIALGGAALQAVYLAIWLTVRAPNVSRTEDFFYVGSVLLAAFLIVAWFGLLLMVGARRKWDWALFGLVAATQIASLIVVYPGFLTA